MHLVLLLGCGDPAVESELAELEEQVTELKEQVADLERKVEARSAPREQRSLKRSRIREGSRDRQDPDASNSTEPEGPATLREAIDDPDGAARLGRALLHRSEDGSFDGYRLSAIRRHTLLGRLGLKNGDIVHAASGHPLDSMQHTMEAFAELRDASEIELDITRGGERMKLVVPVDTPPPSGGEAAP